MMQFCVSEPDALGILHNFFLRCFSNFLLILLLLKVELVYAFTKHKMNVDTVIPSLVCVALVFTVSSMSLFVSTAFEVEKK